MTLATIAHEPSLVGPDGSARTPSVVLQSRQKPAPILNFRAGYLHPLSTGTRAWYWPSGLCCFGPALADPLVEQGSSARRRIRFTARRPTDRRV
jgi:hypothetical protein